MKKAYRIANHDSWFSAYENQPMPRTVFGHQNIFILEGIEIWLKVLTERYDIEQSREIWKSFLDEWLAWEKEDISRKLIVIGTDITKGIVPLEKENRNWRDLTGWAYQDTADKAEKVDVIWYGLNHKIK